MYVTKILKGKIAQEQIEMGSQYVKMVKPMLLALEKLDKILNNEFTLGLCVDMSSEVRAHEIWAFEIKAELQISDGAAVFKIFCKRAKCDVQMISGA